MAAAAPARPVQPNFLRPIVADVQFDYKSGRTAEGWPLESIKAGGLPGLTAYACFYVSRHKRPQLMGPNQNKIGLDPEFCHVFWAELPGFTTVSALIDAMTAYARSPLKTGDRTACLTVLDGLIWALAPQQQYASWLHTVSQVELLAGARKVISAVRETLAATGQGALTDLETEALEEAEAVLKEAGRVADSVASTGCTLVSAPQVDSILASVYGAATRHFPPSDPPTPVPVASYPTDSATAVDSLWGCPFEAIAAAWTHAEAAAFRSIAFHEWRVAGWDRARYEHAADGVRRFIDHYNAGALWVTSEVLVGSTPVARAATITRFIQVASTLRRLNNFSALFQIATGLRRDSVARLKDSWALVPPQAMERWQQVLALAGKWHFTLVTSDLCRWRWRVSEAEVIMPITDVNATHSKLPLYFL